MNPKNPSSSPQKNTLFHPILDSTSPRTPQVVLKNSHFIPHQTLSPNPINPTPLHYTIQKPDILSKDAPLSPPRNNYHQQLSQSPSKNLINTSKWQKLQGITLSSSPTKITQKKTGLSLAKVEEIVKNQPLPQPKTQKETVMNTPSSPIQSQNNAMKNSINKQNHLLYQSCSPTTFLRKQSIPVHTVQSLVLSNKTPDSKQLLIYHSLSPQITLHNSIILQQQQKGMVKQSDIPLVVSPPPRILTKISSSQLQSPIKHCKLISSIQGSPLRTSQSPVKKVLLPPPSVTVKKPLLTQKIIHTSSPLKPSQKAEIIVQKPQISQQIIYHHSPIKSMDSIKQSISTQTINKSPAPRVQSVIIDRQSPVKSVQNLKNSINSPVITVKKSPIRFISQDQLPMKAVDSIIINNKSPLRYSLSPEKPLSLTDSIVHKKVTKINGINVSPQKHLIPDRTTQSIIINNTQQPIIVTQKSPIKTLRTGILDPLEVIKRSQDLLKQEEQKKQNQNNNNKGKKNINLPKKDLQIINSIPPVTSAILSNKSINGIGNTINQNKTPTSTNQFTSYFQGNMPTKSPYEKLNADQIYRSAAKKVSDSVQKPGQKDLVLQSQQQCTTTIKQKPSQRYAFLNDKLDLTQKQNQNYNQKSPSCYTQASTQQTYDRFNSSSGGKTNSRKPSDNPTLLSSFHHQQNSSGQSFQIGNDNKKGVNIPQFDEEDQIAYTESPTQKSPKNTPFINNLQKSLNDASNKNSQTSQQNYNLFQQEEDKIKRQKSPTKKSQNNQYNNNDDDINNNNNSGLNMYTFQQNDSSSNCTKSQQNSVQNSQKVIKSIQNSEQNLGISQNNQSKLQKSQNSQHSAHNNNKNKNKNSNIGANSTSYLNINNQSFQNQNTSNSNQYLKSSNDQIRMTTNNYTDNNDQIDSNINTHLLKSEQNSINISNNNSQNSVSPQRTIRISPQRSQQNSFNKTSQQTFPPNSNKNSRVFNDQSSQSQTQNIQYPQFPLESVSDNQQNSQTQNQNQNISLNSPGQQQKSIEEYINNSNQEISTINNIYNTNNNTQSQLDYNTNNNNSHRNNSSNSPPKSQNRDTRTSDNQFIQNQYYLGNNLPKQQQQIFKSLNVSNEKEEFNQNKPFSHQNMIQFQGNLTNQALQQSQNTSSSNNYHIGQLYDSQNGKNTNNNNSQNIMIKNESENQQFSTPPRSKTTPKNYISPSSSSVQNPQNTKQQSQNSIQNAQNSQFSLKQVYQNSNPISHNQIPQSQNMYYNTHSQLNLPHSNNNSDRNNYQLNQNQQEQFEESQGFYNQDDANSYNQIISQKSTPHKSPTFSPQKPQNYNSSYKYQQDITPTTNNTSNNKKYQYSHNISPISNYKDYQFQDNILQQQQEQQKTLPFQQQLGQQNQIRSYSQPCKGKPNYAYQRDMSVLKEAIEYLASNQAKHPIKQKV